MADGEGEGVCGVDLEGRIIFANQAARRMFGWAEGEGLGQNLHQLTHHHRADGSVYPPSQCPVAQTMRERTTKEWLDLFGELENLFRSYAETGGGRRRKYLHDPVEAAPYQQDPGTFTPWEELSPDTDMLFYEGLHGGVVTPEVNIARYPDLLIGVVPVINLEWIQKLYRDKNVRGYSAEAVTDTILRRMPDYVHYIVPQFAHTHVNFQRVPVVDTSNPFIARDIPSADESICVIRFANPKGIDFPYLLNMIHNSWMSRANTLVVPGGKMELAMQLIFTPMILRLVERRKKALAH